MLNHDVLVGRVALWRQHGEVEDGKVAGGGDVGPDDQPHEHAGHDVLGWVDHASVFNAQFVVEPCPSLAVSFVGADFFAGGCWFGERGFPGQGGKQNYLLAGVGEFLEGILFIGGGLGFGVVVYGVFEGDDGFSE